MSRPLRIQFPAAVYHVMNRGAARQPTFADDGDYEAFLDTVGQAHRLWGIESKIAREKTFRDWIEKIAASIHQLQT